MRQPSSAAYPLALALLLSTPFFCAAQDAEPAASESTLQPSSSQPLSLERYMGRWYVIGRVPNPVERGHVASHHDYRLEDPADGKVQINYYYRENFDSPVQVLNLRARVDQDSGNRRWRTWFYRIIPTRTEVLEVAADYSWALVGYPGRDMAWILSREPDMSQTRYFELTQRLAEHRVNTDRMRRVLQAPEQQGRLGFETPGRR